MKIYQYKSPIGIFRIQQMDDGRWGLWIKEELLGSYHLAMHAADDVYVHVTGYYEWDSREEKGNTPTDIYEWELITR